MNDREFLLKAIEISKESIKAGGFPVGAIVTQNDSVLSSGISNGKQLKDATSHAEIAAIRTAEEKIQNRKISDGVIYTSMEPCLMCFSACYWAGIKKIVYAISKQKLDPMHWEGLHDLHKINQKNNRSIEIVHIKELEEGALKIVLDWENKLQ